MRIVFNLGDPETSIPDALTGLTPMLRSEAAIYGGDAGAADGRLSGREFMIFAATR